MKTEILPTSQFKVSEVQLTYTPKVKASQRIQITKCADVYQILLAGWDPNKIQFIEQMKVVLLNCSSHILGIYELSTGGIDFTNVDLRLLFCAAIKANATRIILAHNHPTGCLEPSRADIKLTQSITTVSPLLKIHVLDHLIISPDGYSSFLNLGLL